MTVAVISFRAAAVSSRLAACCSVRRDRSSEAAKISWVPDWIAAVLPAIFKIVFCIFSSERLKSIRRLSKIRPERRLDAVFEVVVGQTRQARPEFVDDLHAFGDVGREFHDLQDLAAQAEDWVVRRLDPDVLTALADPFELSGDILATVQLLPEAGVLSRLRIARFDEDTVVAPFDLVERVTQCRAEVLVGRDDFSSRRELDHCLYERNRVELRSRSRRASACRR